VGVRLQVPTQPELWYSHGLELRIGDRGYGGCNREKKGAAPKDNRVATGPAKQNNIAGVQAGGEELWLPEHVFQIVLLAAIFGDGRAELKVDGRAGRGD